MTFTRTHWELPGPSAFIADVIERVRTAGVAAIIAPPHCPKDLDVALREGLELFDLPIVDARDGAPPLEALSTAFDIDLKSARSLAVTAEAEGRAAFVTGLDAATVLRWETTLRAYISGCAGRSRFGALILLTAAPECQSLLARLGLACSPWRNVIGFRDALLWAMRDQSLSDPMLGRLAAETAVALAGWELTEVSRQMRRLQSAKALFETPPSTLSTDSASWGNGTLDDFDGVAFKPMALCGSDEIARRLWRAQVTVLFGWLESLRTEFVRGHQSWPTERTSANLHSVDLSELEWPELCHLARQSLSAGDLRRRLAENARLVRNALAHMKPVDFELFARLSHCARQLGLG